MPDQPIITPDKQSPLETVAHPGIYGAPVDTPGVDISERLCESLVQVQSWPNTLAKVKTAIGKLSGLRPKDHNLSGEKDGVVIMPVGPGRFLIEDDSTDLETRAREAIATETGAVTGLTHARVVITLTGDQVEWVLSSLVALDFSTENFAVGSVRLSHHHEIGLVIRRIAVDQFDLYVFTSYARGFWHALTTAAQEVGYSVS